MFDAKYTGATFTVNEDETSGYLIETLTATDDDVAVTSFVYSVQNADGGPFVIAGASTDELQTNGALDFETKTSYSVTLR